MTAARRSFHISPVSEVITITYIDCPQCGVPFAEPFLASTDSYRLARIHSASDGPPCRVLLTIYPDGEAESEIVPATMSFEDALQDHLLDEVEPRQWRMH
jgi:hypothetical protein